MELPVFRSYNTARASVYGHSSKKMNNTLRNVNVKIAACSRPTVCQKYDILRSLAHIPMQKRARNVGARLRFASQTSLRLISRRSGTREHPMIALFRLTHRPFMLAERSRFTREIAPRARLNPRDARLTDRSN